MARYRNMLDDDIFDGLSAGVGRMVTLCTQSGGVSGRGFTGLLVDVNCNYCKLITELPSAPTSPFGLNNSGVLGARNNSCSCRDPLGTVIVIPLDKIVAFIFNNI